MMREAILNYDIENSTDDYDRNMWYIKTSEKEILYNCICGWGDELEKVGFKKEDIELLINNNFKFNVEFTNKKDYYIIVN